VDLSKDTIGAVNVTVNWTLSGGDSADFYLINIITNAPLTPYRGLLNITSSRVTQYELTRFIAGFEYNITICGVSMNCSGLVGSESEPLIIRPQGIGKPHDTQVYTLYISRSSSVTRCLLVIWFTVPVESTLIGQYMSFEHQVNLDTLK